jgi:DNA repair exonuclease SbcCD ATPase subunit
MEFGRIRVRNFRSYRDERLDLSSLGPVCVSGENGAGKSTLFVDAPLWALFGRAHMDLDEAVGPFGPEARVDLEVITPERTYLVARKRKRGSASDLTVSIIGDGKTTPVASGPSAAQEFIDKHILMGRGYKEFIASVYMVQGQHSTFTGATTAEAKDIFASLMALDDWAHRTARTHEIRRGVSTEAERVFRTITDIVPGDIGEAKERLAEAAETEKTHKAAQDAAIETEAELKAQYDGMAGAAERLAKNAERIRAGESQIALCEERSATLKARIAHQEKALKDFGEYDLPALEKAAAEASSIAEASDKWNSEFGGLTSEIAVVAEVVADLDVKVSEAQAALDSIDLTCPTCGQDLTEKAKAEAIRERTQLLRVKTDERAMHSKRLKDLKAKQKKAGKPPIYNPIEQRKTLERYQAARDTEALTTGLPDLRNDLSQNEALLKTRRADLTALREETQGDEGVDIAALSDLIKDAKVRRGEAEDDYRAAVAEHGSAQRLVETLREAEGKAKVLREKHRELTDRETVLTLAEQVFGRDGLPASLMEAAVPHVEEVANELLSAMSDGALRMTLRMERETKTAGMKDALDIVISDGESERRFATFSGGEGFRINFALRVALAEVVAHRSGLDLSMLVIDEPEGLDATGRQHLVSCLTMVSERFKNVVLISHHADLREALPASLVVTKTTDGSRIAGVPDGTE